MGSENDVSRRRFLHQLGAGASAGWLGSHWPALSAAGAAATAAAAAARPFVHLTPAEAIELEAVAEQIVPRTDTPGARDAGVIHFIDQAFDGPVAGAAIGARQGLPGFSGALREQHPEAGLFSALDFEAQTAFLRSQEQGGFFRTMRFLTVLGLFTMPAYGGNRNHLGWQLLGFEHQHVWAPPFGYYDAGAHDTEARK